MWWQRGRFTCVRRRPAICGGRRSGAGSQDGSGRLETLSDREQTVLSLMAQGYSGAEIARQLGVSTRTIDAYKRRVQEKLGLQHRTDYVKFAIEAGVLGV